MEKAMESALDNICDMFSLSLSSVAHDQLHGLENELSSIINTNENDIWNLLWGRS
jgi:hypothetical protein